MALYLQVLKTLQDKFYHLVSAGDFTRICHTPEVKEEAIQILESLCGVAKGSRVDNIDKIFDFLLPLLQHCVTMLGKPGRSQIALYTAAIAFSK